MYRGGSVAPATLLNLTCPQYAHSLRPERLPVRQAHDNSSHRGGLQFSGGRSVQPALIPRISQQSDPSHAATSRGRGGLPGQNPRPPSNGTYGANVPDAPQQVMSILQPNHVTSTPGRGRGRGQSVWGSGNPPQVNTYKSVPPPPILSARGSGFHRGRGRPTPNAIFKPRVSAPGFVSPPTNGVNTQQQHVPVPGGRGTRGRRGHRGRGSIQSGDQV